MSENVNIPGPGRVITVSPAPGSANISRKGIDVFTAWACTENSGKMARKMIADTRFKLLIDNIMTFVGREDKNRVHY